MPRRKGGVTAEKMLEGFERVLEMRRALTADADRARLQRFDRQLMKRLGTAELLGRVERFISDFDAETETSAVRQQRAISSAHGLLLEVAEELLPAMPVRRESIIDFTNGGHERGLTKREARDERGGRAAKRKAAAEHAALVCNDIARAVHATLPRHVLRHLHEAAGEIAAAYGRGADERQADLLAAIRHKRFKAALASRSRGNGGPSAAASALLSIALSISTSTIDQQRKAARRAGTDTRNG